MVTLKQNKIKSNATHTKDFGEKIVAKLPDYNRILKFAYSPCVDDLHCASQNWKKKNPFENSVV
jgi:hypothetical protein